MKNMCIFSGVVPDCVIDELREKKLGLKEPEENGNKTNAIMLGNFDVVEEMIAAIPEAKTCKLQVDKLIDVAGPPKGCENLRELIAMDKMKFDVAGDDFAKILKAKVEDQIERYATIIAFAVYCKQVINIFNSRDPVSVHSCHVSLFVKTEVFA